MSELGQCLLAFVFGSVVGLLVQRSRFCNTAALRDAILFKTYRNTKALLIAMMILTVGFTAFITIGEGKTMHFDVGLNQFAGLFIFGIGMVLAGACTVSTWVKAGEGNFGAVWALLFGRSRHADHQLSGKTKGPARDSGRPRSCAGLDGDLCL